MITLWTLVMFFEGYKAGGAVTIPGYKTREECVQAVRFVKIQLPYDNSRAFCLPVKK